MKIEISDGEILDKFSILTIKSEKIKDQTKLVNIYKEISCLHIVYNQIINKHTKVINLYNDLIYINKKLWNIEDNIRLKENNLCFDEVFINLARDVYKSNDERARIKKEINLITKSNLIEEKSYEST
jgi:hypothetical protein